MTTIKPVGNRVLIEPTKAITKSPSGLIDIPETAQETPSEFIVRALGQGKRNKDGTFEPITEVKVGDVVVMGRYSTAGSIFVNDIMCQVVSVDDILCVNQ